MSDVAEIARKLSESEKRDLTSNWDHFCDADYGLMRSDDAEYPAELEKAGYAELIPVDADALDSSFAWERGIEKGGMMWSLTASGQAVRTFLQSQAQSVGNVGGVA